MPQILLSENEYADELQLLAMEIQGVQDIYHTYEEINRLALSDESVMASLQRDAGFWNRQMYCLQLSLFITLGRIFDHRPGTHTIHTLVNATLGNIHLFSAAALSARKWRVGEPIWLDDYIAEAWIPSGADDLRQLKKALAPHAKHFEEIYRPIRHAIFAHCNQSDAQAFPLFGGTNRVHVGEIIDFLLDLLWTIQNLYDHGVQPELGTRDFQSSNQLVRDGVAAVLNRLI